MFNTLYVVCTMYVCMNVQSGPAKVSYFAPIVLDFQVSHHLPQS